MTNSYGVAKSEVVLLKQSVIAPVPGDPKNPQSNNVDKGAELILHCQIGSTYPKPDITWYISPKDNLNDEVEVVEGLRRRKDLDGNLLFSNVREVREILSRASYLPHIC